MQAPRTVIFTAFAMAATGCEDPTDGEAILETEELSSFEDLWANNDPGNTPSLPSHLDVDIKAHDGEQLMCPPSPEPCKLKPDTDNDYVPWNPYPVPAGTTCFRATGPLCPGLCLEGGAWLEEFNCKIAADTLKLQGWYKIDALNKIWILFDPQTSAVPLQGYSQGGVVKVKLQKYYRLKYPGDMYPVEWYPDLNWSYTLLEKYVH